MLDLGPRCFSRHSRYERSVLHDDFEINIGQIFRFEVFGEVSVQLFEKCRLRTWCS